MTLDDARTVPISVVMPAYNASKTIVAALDSIAAQNWPQLEMVVVDDCSKDETAAIVEAYTRMPVKLVRQEKNRGVFGTLNHGIRSASHDILAFLDSDDEWLPGKLDTQMPLFLGTPGAVFSATGSEWLTRDGQFVRTMGAEPVPFNGDQFWRTQFARTTISGVTVIGRRADFLNFGGFDESLPNASDQDMWMKLALKGPAVIIPDILARVYVSAGSVTARLKAENHRLEALIYSRFLDEVRARLPGNAGEQLIAARMAVIGKDLCGYGHWDEGAPHLWHAVKSGVAPMQNLWYLFTTHPFVSRLKKLGRPAQA
jgi:glycosyltransferase involved in cell wall biosynthesis